MKRWLVVILLAVVVLGGVFALRSAAGRRLGSQDFQTVEAARGTLQSIVGATGTVRANRSAVINFQTSGSVADVAVAVGDPVQEGQNLAELSPDSLSSQILLARADLVSAQQALENLQDNEVALAQAQLAVAQAQDALDKAQYTEQVQQEGYRASSETIAEAKANLVLAQNEVDRAQDEYSKYSGRPDDDPAKALARSNLAAARQRRDSVLRQLNWYLGSPSDIDQALLSADVAIALANLHAAQDEYQRLSEGPDPDEVAAAQARVEAAQATINLSTIEAPFSGTVTAVHLKPGDLVSPNQPAIEIYDLSRLFVDVEISEVDIDKIEADQPVSLVFDALLNREYTGKVIQVGLTGSNNQGIVTFDVTVELLDADEDVRPGLTAAVNIVTRELQDVLIIPNRAVRVQDGQRVAYVLRNGLPQEIEVELGESSDTESEVLSGDLHEGDLIILNPPASIEFGGGGGNLPF